MLGAYGWAFVKPVRKLCYNLTITFVSVVVTFVVGGIEVLGLLAEHFRLSGAFWNTAHRLNENFSAHGYFIIALFVLSLILLIAVYRWRRYDELEVRAEVSI
jgi:high-affinity nickel-transport protein